MDFSRRANTSSRIGRGPKISVILPVYNVEPYIERCVNSLKAQTFRDLEFIFVDDRSTDGSMRVVEQWAEEEDRVHILRNEKNAGSGHSRNCGIAVASGEYLSFVDPDDYVSPTFYELLYAKAIDNGTRDIAKGRQVTIEPTTSKSTFSDKNEVIAARQIKGAPLWYLFDNEHFTAIFHHSLFQNPIARYGSSRVSQDITFLLRICSLTNDIAFENRAEYFYAKRSGSASSTKNPQRASWLIDGLAEKIEILLHQKETVYKRWYLNRYLDWCYCVLFDCLGKKPRACLEASDLADKLEILLRSIPQYEQLARTHPEVSLFAQHSILLPPNGEDSLVRLKAWDDLVAGKAEIAGAYSDAYIDLAEKALAAATLPDRLRIWMHLCRFGYGSAGRLAERKLLRGYKNLMGKDA